MEIQYLSRILAIIFNMIISIVYWINTVLLLQYNILFVVYMFKYYV